ncbi:MULTISPECIES: FecR family protein [unclassified Novosphingobium]|uniref:FecR family protein n=1 Tax=unclassified Novosphingobium TaxID=2644732 RepID=UPI00086C0711|nr:MULTISPECIES: FecR domain-containing protein [unclassified Novosphingobium]MDR6708798.1 transmembrane sensor [Novosphingobium sp. 1748]ODU82891.1 MAG: hypothetical protein ABT10_08975 [Novosphingobium sp. SCN 63-17]OJX96594.1 MAG: hypothetical protein BGP00_18940 [Novosphingobium sp. 63-713]
MARESDTPQAWNEAYRWVEQDPAHGVAFAKAEASWEMAGTLRAPTRADNDAVVHGVGANDDMAADGDEAPANPSRRRFAAMAAGVGLVAAAGGAIWRYAGPARYSTAVGETRLIQLPDGSKVRLNTDSAIDVAFEREIRQVHFVRGEAHFRIARDASRPFLISARDGDVETTGTDMNLRVRPDLTELTVLDGKVAVLDHGRTLTEVSSGSSAMMRAAAISVVPLPKGELAQKTAWQQGEIYLQGETLAQAVEEFNRYRRAPMVISDPRIANIRVGGMFSARNSDDFIATIHESLGIDAITGSDGSVMLIRKSRGEDQT